MLLRLVSWFLFFAESVDLLPNSFELTRWHDTLYMELFDVHSVLFHHTQRLTQVVEPGHYAGYIHANILSSTWYHLVDGREHCSFSADAINAPGHLLEHN